MNPRPAAAPAVAWTEHNGFHCATVGTIHLEVFPGTSGWQVQMRRVRVAGVTLGSGWADAYVYDADLATAQRAALALAAALDGGDS